jgi:hypothetical protein
MTSLVEPDCHLRSRVPQFPRRMRVGFVAGDAHHAGAGGLERLVNGSPQGIRVYNLGF